MSTPPEDINFKGTHEVRAFKERGAINVILSLNHKKAGHWWATAWTPTTPYGDVGFSDTRPDLVFDDNTVRTAMEEAFSRLIGVNSH